MYNRKYDVLAKRIFSSESNIGVSKKRRVTLGQVSESDSAEKSLKRRPEGSLCTAQLHGQRRERQCIGRKERNEGFPSCFPSCIHRGLHGGWNIRMPAHS